MRKSIGVVIPVYNPDIQVLINYTQEIYTSLEPQKIILEWDEPSPEEVEKVREQLPSIEINLSSKRRGKGAAITNGFDSLDMDILAFADSDGSTPVKDFTKVVEAVGGDTDLSVGSRRHPESRVYEHQSIVQRFLGDIFAWFARRAMVTSLYDYQCGAKAIKRDKWEKIRPEIRSRGFSWDIELIAETEENGGKVEEIPIEWRDKPDSTVRTFRTSLKMAITLFRKSQNRF